MMMSLCSRTASGHRPLGRDAVEDRAGALQRMRPAHGLEPAHERGVVRLEEQQAQLRPVAVAGASAASFSSVSSWPPRTSTTTAMRDSRSSGVAREVEQRPQHLRRQVVDDVPAEVLEGVADRRPARAGHAGDDQDGLVRGRGGHGGAGLGRDAVRHDSVTPGERGSVAPAILPVGALGAADRGELHRVRGGLDDRRDVVGGALVVAVRTPPSRRRRAARRPRRRARDRSRSPPRCRRGSRVRSFATDPKCRSSTRTRASPSPGISASCEAMSRLRRLRWCVIANRCASSRRRWSRNSASELRGRMTGKSLSGCQISSSRFARPASARPVTPASSSARCGGRHLRLAAVDDAAGWAGRRTAPPAPRAPTPRPRGARAGGAAPGTSSRCRRWTTRR